ncbi:MAG: fibronectin type III domain-containing protein [Clostridiales bacterium]|jgi:titin|nr:fibronectin type III domain-containing protein [Clostridiales bacterium]
MNKHTIMKIPIIIIFFIFVFIIFFDKKNSTIAEVPGSLEVPENFEASPDDEGGVILTWKTETDLDYELSINNNTTWTKINNIQTNSGIAAVNLQLATYNFVMGTTYNFKIRSVKDAITSNATQNKIAIPRKPPESPKNFSSTPNNSGDVVLSWVKPNTNGNEIKSYKISVDNGDFTIIDNTNSETLTVTLTEVNYNFVMGQSYSFRLLAVNDAGDGAISVSSSAIPRKPPESPKNFSSTPNNSGDVVLSWVKPNTNGNEITSYKISISNGSFTTITGSSDSSLSATLEKNTYNFVMGQSYNFKLLAVNDAGDGASTSNVSATPDIPPGAPSNISVVESNKRLNINWLDATNLGSSIIRYEYRYKRNDSGGFNNWTSNRLNKSVSLTNLENEKKYTFEVRAFNTMYGQILSTSSRQYGPHLEIITDKNLPSNRLNKNYQTSIQANLNSGDAVQWSLAAGRLPLGLTINQSTGNVSGSPTQAGVYRFKVKVKNNK